MGTGVNAALYVSALLVPPRRCPDVACVPKPVFASEVSESFDTVITTQPLHIPTIKLLDSRDPGHFFP